MSYIGNPIVSTDFPKDTFSGNGSTTAFTMSIAPASVNSVIVVVSGITQDPSTYTISGTTLTFSAAPPTGTSNISVRHLGVAGIPNTPSAGSVVATSIADGVITAAKFASGQTPSFNGIAFPATQSASADANTLDDYEEGTWTPTYSGSGATFAYSGAEYGGFYTKIGNMVLATAVFSVSSRTGGSGPLLIAGFPFTAKSSSLYHSGTIGTIYGWTHASSYCQYGVRIPAGGTTSQVFEFGTQGGTATDSQVQVTQVPTGASYASFSWVYQAA